MMQAADALLPRSGSRAESSGGRGIRQGGIP